MFIRFLSFVAIVGMLFLNEGHANPPGHNEESPQTHKRGRDDDRENKENKENKTPLKKEKVEVIHSPFSQYSPETAERMFFSPPRRMLAAEEYKHGKKKSAVDSDFVRKIYNREVMQTFFECVEVEGKVVYQRNKLFDPSSKVLSKKGVWETNFQRMERGLCPVGYKGIASESDVSSLNQKEIRKQQKLYRIELHHLTQKDTGTDRDPICEMTHSAHMGKKTRSILKYDFLAHELEIIKSSLEKEAAMALLDQLLNDIDDSVKTNSIYWMATDLNHFRQGSSLIDRQLFVKWKKIYWKRRAEALKNASIMRSIDFNI